MEGNKLINSQRWKQLSPFKYLGCDVTYQNEKWPLRKNPFNRPFKRICDIYNIRGTIFKNSKEEVRDETQISFHKAIAVLSSLCDFECWAPIKDDLRVLQITEIKILRGDARMFTTITYTCIRRWTVCVHTLSLRNTLKGSCHACSLSDVIPSKNNVCRPVLMVV